MKKKHNPPQRIAGAALTHGSPGAEEWKGKTMFFKRKKSNNSKTLIEIKPVIENGIKWYKVSWVLLDGKFYVDSGVIDYFYKRSEAEDLARHCVVHGTPEMALFIEEKS